MRNFSNSAGYRFFVQIVLAAGLFITNIGYHPAKITVSHTPSHIVFIEDSWNEGLKQAGLQNKYIFLDAYTSWCGPCKMLKINTFTDNKAAAFYNSNFINVSINLEKGQGPELARIWGLKSVPTLIIFDPKGKPVLGTVGYIKADDLIRFGRQALKK